MAITRKEKDGTVTLKIEGSLSIYEAAAFREELLTCFEKFEDLTLVLNGVDDCDTAGLQLLCAARKTAEATGKTLTVSDAPQPVTDTLQSAGLNPDEILNTETQSQINREESYGQSHHDGG